MGYMTQYVIEWEQLEGERLVPSCTHLNPDNAKFCNECGRAVKNISYDDFIVIFLGEHTDEYYGIVPFDDYAEPCKWYDHQEKMVVLSKKFPTVLFTLSGEGEESGDLWVKYFFNGKCQIEKAKVTYNKFDRSKLI